MKHGLDDLRTVLARAALAFGATVVRVGFEDSVYYEPEGVATSNDVLVKKIRHVIEQLGLKIATVQEARDLMLRQ